MRYLTDRKRAEGLGTAHAGVEHFWRVKLTSVALLILVPLFVFTFGSQLGQDHASVTAYFARPFPALVAALTIVVGFKHFHDGATVMIEDYVRGSARKAALVALALISWGAAAAGLFAIARLAL